MLNRTALINLCRQALAEDIGSGDATTERVVPATAVTEGTLVTREECSCAGLPVAETVFAELDPTMSFEPLVQDGDRCVPGQKLAVIAGSARTLLTGERTALNFLQRLCGIATETRRYVDAVGAGNTKILDTRKTTPGLRALEKYAVAMGGGTNHRFGLYDRVMIKDNHLAIARLEGVGAIARAVEACRERSPDLEIEVEADTLDDVVAAAEAGADYILLDNMSNDEMSEAVRLADGRSLLEASGGITLERIPAIAGLGVDFISVGALTHSARAVDISLDIAIPGGTP